MSILKKTLMRVETNGTKTPVHLATSSDIVSYNDTTVSAILDQLLPSSGTTTTSCLPRPTAFDTAAVGASGKWGTETWTLVHKYGTIGIIANFQSMKYVVYSSAAGKCGEYLGSTLYNAALAEAISKGLFDANYVIPQAGLPVFTASYDQLMGDFEYFKTAANRKMMTNGWLSTSYFDGMLNSHISFYVTSSGSPDYAEQNESKYFYPFVAIRLHD